MNGRTPWILLLLGALTAGAGAAERLTLSRALRLALERNPAVAEARNRAEIARRNAHPGMAGLLPTVSLSGGTAWQSTAGTDMTTTSGQVQAAYTLFDGRGGVILLRQLRSDSRRAELETRQAVEAVLLQVGTTYTRAAAAWENREIARELLDISRARLERVNARSRFGQSRTIDVLNARVDFTADRVTLERADFSWKAACRDLNALLDRPLDTEFTVETGVDLSPEESLAIETARALKGNAAFLTALESTTGARLELGLARAARLPRLDLSASYGFTRTAPGLEIGAGGADAVARAGLTVSFDLFNGFRHRIRQQTARLALQSSELAARAARLEVENAVASAWESRRNARQVLELEKESLEAARVNFERSRELFRLGQLTAVEFREAQLNLARARSAVATAGYDARLEEMRLEQLTGRLMVKVTKPQS